MRTEIRMAGFGGQGVVFAGQLLGEAAIRDGKRRFKPSLTARNHAAERLAARC